MPATAPTGPYEVEVRALCRRRRSLARQTDEFRGGEDPASEQRLASGAHDYGRCSMGWRRSSVALLLGWLASGDLPARLKHFLIYVGTGWREEARWIDAQPSQRIS
jgi:hypothetical protein